MTKGVLRGSLTGPTRVARLRQVVALLLSLSMLVGLGCRRTPKSDPDSETKPVSGSLPGLVLKDDTADLLLTWVDEKGDFHTVLKLADVPEGARQAVRVVVTMREDGTGQLVYVADLTKKQPDGSYEVRTVSRGAWEEQGAAKRKARLERLAPPATGSVPSGVASAAPSSSSSPRAGVKVAAVVYGASWCRPCHDAERYLREHGAQVTMKDIDESAVARAEMKRKLEDAGIPATASIPIIDVAGQILVGFNPSSLARAIERARLTRPM